MKTKQQILFIFFTFIFVLHTIMVAQVYQGKSYRVDKFEKIYLPLGKISFADSIVSFKMGKPKPFKKYRDPLQSLHEPNYINYSIPNFVSLGCRGVLTVAFTDNGFMNLPGKDLYIFEVGPSEESAKIEISENGKDWIFAGNISGGKSIIDLNDEGISSETVFYFLRITDLEKVCNSKTAGADIDAIGAINSVIKISINADILFDTDKFILKKSAKQILDTLAVTIKKISKATILVEGHTDSDGTAAYNATLSKRRSLSVIEKLKSLFDADALYDYELKAYGEEKPRVPNNTMENKQLNRRVEIMVLPPKDYYKAIREEK